MLIKTDEDGDPLWSKTLFDSSHYIRDHLFVQQTIDNGYIITGATKPIGNDDYDILLIKTDEDGDSLWTRTFGEVFVDDYAKYVQQTIDGGYMCIIYLFM